MYSCTLVFENHIHRISSRVFLPWKLFRAGFIAPNPSCHYQCATGHGLWIRRPGSKLESPLMTLWSETWPLTGQHSSSLISRVALIVMLDHFSYVISLRIESEVTHVTALWKKKITHRLWFWLFFYSPDSVFSFTELKV